MFVYRDVTSIIVVIIIIIIIIDTNITSVGTFVFPIKLMKSVESLLRLETSVF